MSRLIRSNSGWLVSCFALLGYWVCGSAARGVAGDTVDLTRPIIAEKDLVYGEADGRKLRADIYRPADDGPHPGVLMIHGGAWSSGDKWNLSDHARELAQAGYVAININYRLAPIFKYPAQIDDCRMALKWLDSINEQQHIDLERLAVYGYSAGGHLAALLATDSRSDLPTIKAAVLGGAPCDLNFVPARSRALAHVMGGTRQELPQVYEQASPLTYASSDDCPAFFYHGENDMIVPPSASRGLCDRLSALGVETTYLSVENQGHLITFVHPSARRAAIEFLNRHLQ